MSEVIQTLEVGSELTTKCTKCKEETYHVVTKIADGLIKKVMCKACNHTHVYKGPQPNVEDKPEAAAEKKAPVRRGRRKKDWQTLKENLDGEEIVEYQIDQDYSETVAIHHKQFGVGIIHKVLSDQHIEVIFQEGTKVLVHNYHV